MVAVVVSEAIVEGADAAPQERLVRVGIRSDDI